MAIPDFQTIMLPLLRFYADGREHANRDVVAVLADDFNLTEDERDKLLPSGTQRLFDNRVAWARSDLKMANLLENPQRGVFRITARGRGVLGGNPKTLNRKFLSRFPEYQEKLHPPKTTEGRVGNGPEDDQKTPEERLEDAYEAIRTALANELLQHVKEASPRFFETLVVELLLKMGYGGTRNDAGRAIGQSGDEGIDGIINEDRLGLDTIYIQAKRWDAPVGRPETQNFAGALQGQRARKGIFITTSGFSREAREYATRIDSKIVLVDGEMLAQLMIDHSVGTTALQTYDIKRIDSDYFTED